MSRIYREKEGPDPMIVQAHAKINLALNVLSKRIDGYHELDMVMVPLALHDTLEVVLAPDQPETTVAVEGAQLPEGSNNLALTAVTKMREIYRFKENFRILIKKRIPMAAGLGGGSSDGAAVVRSLIAILKLQPQDQDVIKLCRALGSDVPFFYRQEAARVQGTGEMLTPLSIKKPYQVMIVKPQAGLSTKAVFAKYDEAPNKPGDIVSVMEALRDDNLSLLAQSLHNQLQPAAEQLCPEIKTIVESLKKDGFDLVLMSGSGSAVFVLSRQLAKLKKAAVKYGKSGYEVLLTQTKTKEGYDL